MKEADLIRALVSARVKFYRIITYSLLAMAMIAMLALAGTIYLPTHTEKEVLISFISILSGLFGALVTILTQGVQAARRLRSDEELQREAERITYEKETGKTLPPEVFSSDVPPKEEP